MEKGIRKVVLAYSGGLDTSVIIKWLQEKYGVEVIAVAVDLGQGGELEPLREKAIKTGASKIYIEDVKEEFVRDYIFRAIKANAQYESKYLLATALARPLIARKVIEVAEKEGADAVAHGCTGKGNDQVRFDVSFRALKPDITIVAPVREWEFKSREEEMEYAARHGIPVTATKKSPYSIDRNLWGISIECGVLEDPWVEPPREIYQMTVDPADSPDEPRYIEIGFEKGVPLSLDGEKMGGVDLIMKLNEIGGAYGVGRMDMVENRLVGIKSREIYEAPAATIIFAAHRHLEDMVLDRETLHFKEMISQKYSELVYYGLWFSPLRRALDAFIDSTQENVTGTIRVKLFKGSATVVGRKSEKALYRYELATYDAKDVFDHRASEGFVKLWGLPLQVYSMVNGPKAE